MEYQTRSTEIPWLSWMGGIALGAIAMYIADPVQGRRRRALIQDKLTHVTHATSRLMDQTLHDAHNRWSGLQASAMRMISPRQAKPIDDHVLEARVRSRLGRAMSHMRDVEVHAHQGAVTLSGNLDSEAQEKVVRLVAAIPGVESVLCPMETHTEKCPRSARAVRSDCWCCRRGFPDLVCTYASSATWPAGRCDRTGTDVAR